MNSPYAQKSGTFQVALSGNELADANGFLTANRRINLAGNFRIKLTGFQGQYNDLRAIDPPPTIPLQEPNPLLMLVSPQMQQNWTPDLPGPVIQWGSTINNQLNLDPTQYSDQYIQYQNRCTFLGQPLNLEFRATLNNLFQIQIRGYDPLEAADLFNPNPPAQGNSVPNQINFNKTIADLFPAYKKMTFVFTFQFEQDGNFY